MTHISDYLNDKLILSFDIEDNFTRDELVDPLDWNTYEPQVVENTQRVINLLNDIEGDATFFIVGKTAERRPEIVKMIDDAGFEIASHGYAHEPVDQMSEKEFEYDLQKSIAILEDISGKKVNGYRAMAFSVNRKTPWAFKVMKRSGLVYDSSLPEMEFNFLSENGDSYGVFEGLTEIPVCNRQFMGKKWAISGGIIMRLMPFSIYKLLLNFCCEKNRCKIIYAHAWEFNADQPKRKVGLLQKLAQSSKTYTTPMKINKFSLNYKLISMRTYLNQN